MAVRPDHARSQQQQDNQRTDELGINACPPDGRRGGMWRLPFRLAV
jgi:hypothetical protein